MGLGIADLLLILKFSPVFIEVGEHANEPRFRGSFPEDRRSPQRSDGAHREWTAFCLC